MKIFKKILNWWREKMLDRAVASAGFTRQSAAPLKNPNCSCEKVFSNEKGDWFCVLCGHQVDKSLLAPEGPQHLFFNYGGDVISSNGKKL
jgi:hypothetical protein